MRKYTRLQISIYLKKTRKERIDKIKTEKENKENRI